MDNPVENLFPKKEDIMVPTKDVNRFIKVMVTTMALARKYGEDWPKSSQTVLAMIRWEEISAELLKVLARPFSEIEVTKPFSQLDALREERGLVISKGWSMSNLVPGDHLICLRRRDREFVMINRANGTVRVGDKLLARVIGGPDYPGNMHLFIDACAGAIEGQIRAREEALCAMQERCLLSQMYEAFDPNKFEVMRSLVSDLTDLT